MSDKIERWIDKQIFYSEKYHKEAKEKTDKEEAAYWLGYLEATINTKAAFNGATDLESEEF